jgi:hypothetical protein
VLGIYQQLGTRGADSVYNEDFAKPFVHHTYHFYSQEAESLIAAQDRSSYVAEAHSRIASELEAAAKYAKPDTLPLLQGACERAFIQQQQQPLQAYFDELLALENRCVVCWPSEFILSAKCMCRCLSEKSPCARDADMRARSLLLAHGVCVV